MLPDIDIRDIPDSVLTICNRNSRIVTKHFDKKFREANCPINATQYDLLRIIWISNGNNGPTIGNKNGIDRSTITRRLPPLLELGYVRIEHSKQDKRIKLLQVTTEGMKLLKKYSKTYMEADAEIPINIETIDPLSKS